MNDPLYVKISLPGRQYRLDLRPGSVSFAGHFIRDFTILKFCSDAVGLKIFLVLYSTCNSTKYSLRQSKLCYTHSKEKQTPGG